MKMDQANRVALSKKFSPRKNKDLSKSVYLKSTPMKITNAAELDKAEEYFNKEVVASAQIKTAHADAVACSNLV